MTLHDLTLQDIPALAGEIAEALRPLVDREVEKRLGVQVVKLATRQRSRDEAIMEACRAVATASDRLAASRFTPDEIPARRALDREAAKLARVMRGRP